MTLTQRKKISQLFWKLYKISLHSTIMQSFNLELLSRVLGLWVILKKVKVARIFMMMTHPYIPSKTRMTLLISKTIILLQLSNLGLRIKIVRYTINFQKQNLNMTLKWMKEEFKIKFQLYKMMEMNHYMIKI